MLQIGMAQGMNMAPNRLPYIVSIAQPAQLNKLTAKFLKHLGRDSIYELY
jgi:hypothetical protein